MIAGSVAKISGTALKYASPARRKAEIDFVDRCSTRASTRSPIHAAAASNQPASSHGFPGGGSSTSTSCKPRHGAVGLELVAAVPPAVRRGLARQAAEHRHAGAAELLHRRVDGRGDVEGVELVELDRGDRERPPVRDPGRPPRSSRARCESPTGSALESRRAPAGGRIRAAGVSGGGARGARVERRRPRARRRPDADQRHEGARRRRRTSSSTSTGSTICAASSATATARSRSARWSPTLS